MKLVWEDTYDDEGFVVAKAHYGDWFVSLRYEDYDSSRWNWLVHCSLSDGRTLLRGFEFEEARRIAVGILLYRAGG